MSFETLLTQDRVDTHTAAGHWVNRTITDYLDEAAEKTPDKTAFIDSRRRISYGALKQQVDRCALGLLELGVAPGDVISFQLPNWIEWIVLHYAATRIGAISNPLIPIYREREVAFMVGLAKSKILVVPREFRGVSRADQDGFALRSQERAAKAISGGRLAREIVPVTVPQRRGDPVLVEVDEHPRQTSLQGSVTST